MTIETVIPRLNFGTALRNAATIALVKVIRISIADDAACAHTPRTRATTI